MGEGPRFVGWRFWSFRRFLPWLTLCLALVLIRSSKGSGFLDFYFLVSKPFWPGPAQKEWLKDGLHSEQHAKLKLLEEDNQRLREILSLERSGGFKGISAPVISRTPKGWWQQLVLGKGIKDGVEIGYVVSGPGGLLGIIDSTTLLTSRVRLLTAPGSRVGVWIPEAQCHAVLIGVGTNRPQLIFLDKAPQISAGYLVSTSPASTLLPANLPIGVIQSIDVQALPTPTATIQLLASAEAIDWVQITKP